MYATDFEYDGKKLSDMGFLICNFDSNGLNVINTGSKITFNKVAMHSGKKYSLVGTKCEFTSSLPCEVTISYTPIVKNII